MLTAIIWLAAMGGACGLILAIAARFFAVHEDPRVEAVTALLPGVNCGGCGFAGCSEYAKAIVTDGQPVNLCNPGGAETVHKIAAFMGIEATTAERKVAMVMCAGGDQLAVRKAAYNGVADCSAAELAGGAGKACRFGCLGYGSCSRVCPVDAIEITGDKLAVVHPDRCISCGKCVAACPRKLIKLVPESRSIHILCSSKDKGPVTKANCKVGCIACTLCVKKAGAGIRMEGALAVVDYAVPLEDEAIVGVCPAKTIVRRSGKKEAAAPAA